MQYCQWLYHLDETELNYWGQEAIDLWKVGQSGALIPAGFVVSREVYELFFLDDQLNKAMNKLVNEVDQNRPATFYPASEKLIKLIKESEFSKDIKKGLQVYFDELRLHLLLGPKKKIRLVLKMGENQIFAEILNVEELEKNLKNLFSLAFTERELYRRLLIKRVIVPDSLPIIIEYQELPEFSGLGMTRDGHTGDESVIEIKANHFQHNRDIKISDLYHFERKNLQLLSRSIKQKWWAENGQGKHISPTALGKQVQTLSDEQAAQLARHIRTAQTAFTDVHQFSWIYTNGKFVITGVHLLTLPPPPRPTSRFAPILFADPLSIGWTVGPIRLINKKSDFDRVQSGDVVVVEKIPVLDQPWIKNAGAIISETGNAKSAGLKIGHQYDLPILGGTRQALSKLFDGQVVTVDAINGALYQGVVEAQTILAEDNWRHHLLESEITGTKVYAIINHPKQIERNSLWAADGIGMLRLEFIHRLVGIHPQEILERNLHDEYVEILTEVVEQAAQSVYPRPTICQLQDLSPNDLIGFRAKHQDRYEPNPLLGYRGLHRLLEEEDVFRMELKVIQAALRAGIRNLHIMLPMARSLAQVDQALRLVRSVDELTEIPIWIKCETPALLIQLIDLDLSVQGVCFDVPALMQLYSGYDRSNYQVGHFHQSASLEVVTEALSEAITNLNEIGISSLLVGEEDLLRPEVVQACVEAGLTAIGVLPEQIEDARRLINSIERRILLDYHLGL
jgi:phosphoenolpyruvate synthase/pyruvate phosphate dikinase